MRTFGHHLLRVGLTLCASTTAFAQQGAFGPGEQMVIRVDYLGIKAGTATVTVGNASKLGQVDCWPIVTIADTEALFSVYPLHDKFVSWWDPGGGHAIAYDFFANENGKLRRERGRLNSPERGKAQVQRAKEESPPSLTSYDIDPAAQDIEAAFFLLRTMSLIPGADLSIPVFTGAHSWNMEVHVDPPEPLAVVAGQFEALPLDVEVHFQGKLETRRKLKVWITNDASHMLLKLQASLVVGSLRGELVEYHPGNVGAPPMR